MSVLAWHFLPANRRLRHGDQRLVELGVPIEVKGPPILWKRGLYASLQPLNALCYAQGPIACRVELDGDILQDSAKLVATWRTVVAWCNATKLLHRFACDMATTVLDFVKERGFIIDERSRTAIAVKRAWLKGAVNNKKLDAAWSAAHTAAKAATHTAAKAATWAAARSATWAAVGVATWVLADTAAWNAVRDAQNRILEQMLIEELKIHSDAIRLAI